MNKEKKTIIILSASSDIGFALCKCWIKKGWNVLGTYRTESKKTDELRQIKVDLVQCDAQDSVSINKACVELISLCGAWDALVACIGDLEPIGHFRKVNFDDWETSIKVNFTSQLRFVHQMLPSCCLDSELEPGVILFAGPGTNNAPENYSAYTISKIGLIKMCEILDVENPKIRFSIIGPGWVKTKIHDSTVEAGEELAGKNFQKTLDMLDDDQWVPMDKVLDCCDWVLQMPKEVVGGRNFSVVFDSWGEASLETKLKNDNNMYKLRRSGNDWTCDEKRKGFYF